MAGRAKVDDPIGDIVAAALRSSRKEERRRQRVKQVVEMIGDYNGMLDFMKAALEHAKYERQLGDMEVVERLPYRLQRKFMLVGKERDRLAKAIRTGGKKLEKKETFKAMFAVWPEPCTSIADIIFEAFGKRGPAKTNSGSAWRGAAVKIMAYAVPEGTPNRYSKIAKACTKAGIDTSRQLARSILLRGRT